MRLNIICKEAKAIGSGELGGLNENEGKHEKYICLQLYGKKSQCLIFIHEFGIFHNSTKP